MPVEDDALLVYEKPNQAATKDTDDDGQWKGGRGQTKPHATNKDDGL